jgi:TPR repeat protein
VFDYAPKRVREQWHRGETDDAAKAEFADDPPTGDDRDPAQAEPGDDADERISSLVPKGPHEDADEDPGDADDTRMQEWEHDDPDREPEEPRQGRTEDWLDELEYRAELRERRAKAAEIDREYEDQLERLAASLRTLRNEDESESDSEPERPLAGESRRGRSLHSADGAERDHYIDGVRLPRFLQASYVPPSSREGRIGWLGVVLAGAIAFGVGVPLSYYAYAVGNPFASKPPEGLTKSDVQYAIASVTDRLPKLEERVADATPTPAPTPAPAPLAAETAPQAASQPAPALQPPAAPAEPSQSAQAPRRVPLTHVVRWPDQAQDNPAPPPPHAAASPLARSAPAAAPNAPAASLAYAPALAPAPAQPAQPAPPPRPRSRPPADETDEVQLMLKQGQDFVAAGDLATARVVLRRAAQSGAATAAFALGQTYDPKVLAKMRARGVEPDPAEARRWYEMAQKLGSSEAGQQLERLARDE